MAAGQAITTLLLLEHARRQTKPFANRQAAINNQHIRQRKETRGSSVGSICVCVCGSLGCLIRATGTGRKVRLIWFGLARFSSAWRGSTPQIFDASTSKRFQQTRRLHLQPGGRSGNIRANRSPGGVSLHQARRTSRHTCDPDERGILQISCLGCLAHPPPRS